MRKYFLSVMLLAISSIHASAIPCFTPGEDKTFFDQPTVMLGIAFNFGGAASAQNFGITAKVLSNDFQDYQAATVGMTYFPKKESSNLGLDVGLAYKATTAVGTVGWDFLSNQLQFSAGYVDAQEPQGSYVCVG